MKLLKLPEKLGHSIAGRIRYINRLLETVLDHADLDDGERRVITSISKRIEKLMEARDQVVHRSWWKVIGEADLIRGRLETRKSPHSPLLDSSELSGAEGHAARS